MGIFKFIVQETAIKAAENVALKTAEVVADYLEKNECSRENSGIVYYKVPTNADEYIGEDKETVFGELKAYGFNNIVLLPRKDLIKGWLNKDGEVIQVKINGKNDFRKNQKFPIESRIVIEYHTFRDK